MSAIYEEARQAVTVYREYFVKTGMFENEVYPGIVKVLSGLKKGGKRLYVATSKPEPFAKEILAHFKLDGFFDFIGGSTLDETGSMTAKGRRKRGFPSSGHFTVMEAAGSWKTPVLRRSQKRRRSFSPC